MPLLLKVDKRARSKESADQKAYEEGRKTKGNRIGRRSTTKQGDALLLMN
jgi:hypothetical protein